MCALLSHSSLHLTAAPTNFDLSSNGVCAFFLHLPAILLGTNASAHCDVVWYLLNVLHLYNVTFLFWYAHTLCPPPPTHFHNVHALLWHITVNLDVTCNSLSSVVMHVCWWWLGNHVCWQYIMYVGGDGWVYHVRCWWWWLGISCLLLLAAGYIMYDASGWVYSYSVVFCLSFFSFLHILLFYMQR